MRRAAILVVVAVLAHSSLASASGDGCHEVSDTVGERRCSRFGMSWATEHSPAMFTSIGAFTSSIAPHGFEHEVTDDIGRTLHATDAKRFVRGAIQTHGGDFRIGGMMSRYGYFAFDFGVGLGHAHGQPYTADGFTLTPAAGVNFLQAYVGPVVGARVPLGKVSFRFEGLVGAQVFALFARANGPSHSESAAGDTAFVWRLEPRVAADVWLTPDTTLSVWGGMNALRPSDRTLGVSLGAHFRAFDGAY